MVPGAREQGGGHFIARLRARRRRGHLAHQETWLTLCPTELQDHPLAASPHFADWRLAASAAQNAALADSTRAKRSSSWNCYARFLERVGVDLDPFLRRFGRNERTEIFACFAAALRDGRLRSRQPATDGNGAMSGTIRATLDGVAQTFRLNKLESPIHDSAGRLDPPSGFTIEENGDKGAKVTQHRNNNPGQADICPVRTLAELIHRIRGYERLGRTNPKINAFVSTTSNELEHVSSKTILEQLRAATILSGEERLGLQADRIGTHSIRSGAAMAMHLAGVPSETIQMVGRWRSRTFMRYLRIQVPDTTIGVATRMTNRQTFFTVAHDPADERQPENGGNQVDSQRRDGPPLDEYHGTDPRDEPGERQNY
ncbi:hypothetical protein MHU86_19706 [Fragilaria crotonensis]|nr:hypothetical protein MHU86_19706 [Fragilaria crotonensis]